MLVPNSETSIDSSTLDLALVDVRTSRKTVAVLDELLAHSIRMRDAYKNARWQTSGIQF
jgi:hypothetical protein